LNIDYEIIFLKIYIKLMTLNCRNLVLLFYYFILLNLSYQEEKFIIEIEILYKGRIEEKMHLRIPVCGRD